MPAIVGAMENPKKRELKEGFTKAKDSGSMKNLGAMENPKKRELKEVILNTDHFA